MKEMYKFRGKEFEDCLSFVKALHQEDYDEIKNEFVEIKCPVTTFVHSSDEYKSEMLNELLRDKPIEIVEAIIKVLEKGEEK